MTNPPDQGSQEAEDVVREVLVALDRLESFVARLRACPNQATLIDQALRLRAECVKAFGNPKPTGHRQRDSAPSKPIA